jgi:hypothetical protein
MVRIWKMVARMGEMRNTIFWIQTLKRPFGRPVRRWEDDIKIVLREIEWECVDLDASGSG